MIGKNLKLDKHIKHFADELKKCFSKDEIEEIARETGFVKRKGKIEAWEFVCLCCFMDAEVANNTLVTLCGVSPTFPTKPTLRQKIDIK